MIKVLQKRIWNYLLNLPLHIYKPFDLLAAQHYQLSCSQMQDSCVIFLSHVQINRRQDQKLDQHGSISIIVELAIQELADDGGLQAVDAGSHCIK